MEIKRNHDQAYQYLEWWSRKLDKILEEKRGCVRIDLRDGELSIKLAEVSYSCISQFCFDTWEDILALHDFLHGLIEKFS